ncbi:MAG: ATP-binding cassette domain-containing protein [Candidatus Saccharimonadales bacterium]
MSKTVIDVKGLRKTFTAKGKPVEAVKGVDLHVESGQIFGFLGPNGAGKTTTLRMLTTLLPIDKGTAIVAGFNVKTKPEEVRKRVGYVSQLGGADNLATGREDLMMQGQLYGMTPKAAGKRVDELSEVLDLKEFINRRIKTYSGGQRRRLDVALGIMHQPEVLFLDEPTTGLDPQNRANLWEQVSKLKGLGVTVFLTTHYLEEADALSDQLAIMDHGKIVAKGTPKELKKQISGDAIVIQPKTDGQTLSEIQAAIASQDFVREARTEGETIRVYVNDGAKALPQVFSLLETKKIAIETVSLSQPSLDDVFLKQTGRSLRDVNANVKGA